MRLHEQVVHQKELLNTHKEWLDDLQRHLNLPKFKDDTTIQVADIHLRINELKQNLFRLGAE